MNKFILILVALAMLWGGYIYYAIYGLGFLEAFYYTMSLFFANMKTASDLGKEITDIAWYKNIYIPGILSLAVLSLAVVSLYVKLAGKSISSWWKIKFGNNILVISLGEGNRAYIDSEIDAGNKNIIAIEMHKNNPYIEHYDKKILVLIADASHESTLKQFNFHNIKHIVISAGQDIININIAKAILHKNPNAKLFLHLTDRSLRHYHKENGVLSGSNVRVFSYYEESARALFYEHAAIDGESNNVIHSDDDYAIAVIGNTILAHEVVAQACIMGQLPNENNLTIYCIDKEIESFKNSIEVNFPNIASVPNVSIEYKNMDYASKEFYLQDFWKKGMTNIIMCYEDDQTNLDIAANLINLQFLDESVDKTMRCKLHIAMSNTDILSESIDNNNELFRNMRIFAQTKNVNKRDNIVAEKRDAQAIATNSIYNTVGVIVVDYENYQYDYCSNDKDWNCKKELYDNSVYMHLTATDWAKKAYFFKESNRAVADHMTTKLKYLGLTTRGSSLDKDTLFTINKNIFEDKLQSHLVKLAKCEHNRWMAFHYLQGYKSMPFISKDDKNHRKEELENKKMHMCLVPFETFKNSSNHLIELGYSEGYFEGYDMMIVKHIPQIMTYAGYILVEMEHA